MNKKGFTLMELLVVIAIMGIILTMLFPAMGRVREGTRRSQCINNLMQHGIGWLLYLDDHDDHFPPNTSIGGDITGGRASTVTFGGKKGVNFGNNAGAAKYRVLNPYLDIDVSKSLADVEKDTGLEVFRCPSDTRPCIPPCTYNITVFNANGTSYYMNSRILWYDPTWKPRPLFTVTSRRDKVYLEQCHFYNTPGHSGKGSSTSTALCMVLFVDSHVGGPYVYYGDFETYLPNTTKPVLVDPNGTSSFDD